ncbi:unnamed protein product [Rotaria sordida]|uniref:Uncharacterized protein n=1 Tax=Rotaria sordida TaxID=392033 RepID=A0A819FNR1_9BILA|nr:unnamed protein product [Rotaria sordida]CAF3871278.1 unnamed protein product [Rotaria sordida]CAF4209931.1 unnamed protein product [Rotaria sordida]
MLSFANFLHTTLSTAYFLNVNLTGAIFTTKLLNFFVIRNSLLPNGTFSPVDGIDIKMNECALLDGWQVIPDRSIQIKNCTLVTTNNNASINRIIPMSLADHSMLINTNQAEFQFKIHENGLPTRILINIVFDNAENLIFDIHDTGMISFRLLK